MSEKKLALANIYKNDLDYVDVEQKILIAFIKKSSWRRKV